MTLTVYGFISNESSSQQLSYSPLFVSHAGVMYSAIRLILSEHLSASLFYGAKDTRQLMA